MSAALPAWLLGICDTHFDTTAARSEGPHLCHSLVLELAVAWVSVKSVPLSSLDPLYVQILCYCLLLTGHTSDSREGRKRNTGLWKEL